MLDAGDRADRPGERRGEPGARGTGHGVAEGWLDPGNNATIEVSNPKDATFRVWVGPAGGVSDRCVGPFPKNCRKLCAYPAGGGVVVDVAARDADNGGDPYLPCGPPNTGGPCALPGASYLGNETYDGNKVCVLLMNSADGRAVHFRVNYSWQ